MRNITIRGYLVISMLFIACVSATSKDVQRKPVDVQTEIPNIENKEQRPAEPPIIVNVSPPQKTHEEIQQEAKERDERSDLDRKIVDLTGSLAKYTLGLFVTAVALVLATIGLGIFSWRQSRDLKDSIAVAKESASAAMLHARAAIGLELPKIILSRVDFGDTGAASLASRLQSPKIEISVTNYGKTPAFLLGQAIEIEVGALLPPEPVYPGAVDLPPETIVEYKNKYPLGTARPKSPLSPEDIQAILDGNTRLRVYGYVYYRDILSEAHMARFCKVFLPPSPPGYRSLFVDDHTPAYTESF
ncbi:MAG: hypothetical protein ACLP4V_01045 [Methylocella sp.]